MKKPVHSWKRRYLFEQVEPLVQQEVKTRVLEEMGDKTRFFYTATFLSILLFGILPLFLSGKYLDPGLVLWVIIPGGLALPFGLLMFYWNERLELDVAIRREIILKNLRNRASELGLEFQEEDEFEIPARFPEFNMLSHARIPSERGSYIREVFSGIYREHRLQVFHLIANPTASGIHFDNFLCCAGILPLDGDYPELKGWSVSGPNYGLKNLLSEAPEVDFDNLEFSRNFNVKCKNKGFAYAVFHPRMMDLFMEHDDIHFEIEANAMMVLFDETMDIELLQEQLDRFVRIKKLLPDYLFRRNASGKTELAQEDDSREEGRVLGDPCPWCGVCSEYVPEYGEYYCWNCWEYLGEMEEADES